MLLEEIIFYPPLALLRSLEDKQLLKFYSLILTVCTMNTESWLAFPGQDAAQPSLHAAGGKHMHTLFGTIIFRFCIKNSKVDVFKTPQINFKLLYSCRTGCLNY